MRKSGLLAAFPRAFHKTNRVLGNAHVPHHTFPPPFFFFSLFLIAGLFCLSGPAVWGQESYRIDEEGRFIQFLDWEDQEDVLYYEVEIEKQRGGLWEKALTGKAETSLFEVSLAPGNYRYRVRPLDLLERPGPAADWIQFEVLPAKQPELFRFSPDGFYLDEDISWVINLSGRNLTSGIEVSLRGPQGSVIRPGTVTVGQSENEVRLTFSYEQLGPGTYVIHVMNPGGLTAELQNFKVAFRKPVDFNVALGYRPLVSLYGQINELFETAFYPLGAYGRLGVIPLKRRWGYVGFELEPSWNYFTVARKNFSIQAHMTGAAIYGVYQYWLSNRVMAFDFRAGAGIYPVLDYHFVFENGKSDPITILIPAIAVGVSFQWFIKKPFFMEAGLDFAHFFTVDNPPPGYLRPFIGAGWQL
jgi:hypothetical protein